MKQIELLDVIGNVDEDLLTESEELTLKRHGPILWKVAAVAAVFAGLAVTAFAAARLVPKVESRSIKNGGVTTGTVSPFEVDNGGNIQIVNPAAQGEIQRIGRKLRSDGQQMLLAHVQPEFQLQRAIAFDDFHLRICTDDKFISIDGDCRIAQGPFGVYIPGIRAAHQQH